MKHLRKLTRAQKKLLSKLGFKPEDYLFEHQDQYGYRFYNIHIEQLMEIPK
ncbi:DUF6906 family protein [Clostridium culturomicium]|uniref:DUF6906 family protein n=1 Tax=Clostridium culturomicium TaxID=1499683 RepID=UPI000B0392D0|nr:hypothetical protein [Clostridium culturomicium]